MKINKSYANAYKFYKKYDKNTIYIVQDPHIFS